jgi:hypothetical protein
MPRRRRHHDDNSHPPQQIRQPGQAKQRAAPQAGFSMQLAEESFIDGSVNSQAEILSSAQFLPAQRSILAGQIAQVQGNRHMQRVVHAARQAVQRQDEPTVHRTVRFGSRGPDVSEAQEKLNTAGAAPPLAVDAIFGPLTRAAVVTFQNNNELAADGVVGPKTWSKLDAAGTGPGPEPEPEPEPVPPPRWSEFDHARLFGQASATGALNAFQAARAEIRINALTSDEFDTFSSLLNSAATDMEYAFLCKALAAQRSLADITLFADRIRGMSQRWLMRNLMVVNLSTNMDEVVDPEERGIQQQYGNSCGPTSVQLIHAQADPIYALELRSAGPIDESEQNSVDNPAGIKNQQLANEQAAMLNAHVATGTGNAPTNYKQGGAGAWVEPDMNALASATGVTYTTQIIGTGITMDNAIAALYAGLASGVHVPIVVGGGTGPTNTSHYVVVLLSQGSQFLVHDVAKGQSVWRTEAQFRTNTLALPSTWNFFVAIDVPTLVPPPLPAPPSPTGG